MSPATPIDKTLIDPGLLSVRLTLETAGETADGQGGAVRIWVPVADLWARLEPVAARRVVAADQASETVTHRITCRRHAQVIAGRRFVKGQRVFEIRTVHDPDESGRYLVCRTEEVDP